MKFKIKKGDYPTLEQWIDSVHQLPKKYSTLLIGIDGCGGAGKSTLAKVLSEKWPNVTVVHMDDFYFPSKQKINKPPAQKPIGADCDWKRVLAQVIEPISKGKQARYQRYDWNTDQLAEWHDVPAGEIVIIEGVYSTRMELANYYDFTIWIDCLRETRLDRGLARDGEEARDMWENNWMIAEDYYLEKHRPQDRANLVIE
ncbi:uridine kinase family protein [Bacillus sp. USDA818B3_A]|uniref:uridine kinase family protein n=1 Tax=Bacillus sp. USDA818B3_A TaxID=2698834 RepID=UPI0013704EAB|nr:AAA family ATPase [Bacillus sp. USDA818B3_A]